MIAQDSWCGKIRRFWAEAALVVFGFAAIGVLSSSFWKITSTGIPTAEARQGNDLPDDLCWNNWERAQRMGKELGAQAVSVILNEFRRGELSETTTVVALIAIGPPAVPLLLEACRDSDAAVRITSIRALDGLLPKSSCRREAAVASLVKLMDDCKGEVRFAAVLSIGRLKSERERAIPGLIAALRVEETDPDEESVFARQGAAHVLGNLGAKARAAVPALERLLLDPNPYTRLRVETALRKIEQSSCAAGNDDRH